MKINEIKNKRVLAKCYSKWVRLVVLTVVALLLFKPMFFVFGKNDLVVNHADVEAGIFCSLNKGFTGIKLSCFKDDNIGLDLNEINLDLKEWVYDVGYSQDLVFSRSGYSDGIKIMVTGFGFEKPIMSEIKYKHK